MIASTPASTARRMAVREFAVHTDVRRPASWARRTYAEVTEPCHGFTADAHASSTGWRGALRTSSARGTSGTSRPNDRSASPSKLWTVTSTPYEKQPSTSATWATRWGFDVGFLSSRRRPVPLGRSASRTCSSVGTRSPAYAGPNQEPASSDRISA